jgi:hypothetical protein
MSSKKYTNWTDYFVKKAGPCPNPDRKGFFPVQIRFDQGKTQIFWASDVLCNRKLNYQTVSEFFTSIKTKAGNSDARQSESSWILQVNFNNDLFV